MSLFYVILVLSLCAVIVTRAADDPADDPATTPFAPDTVTMPAVPGPATMPPAPGVPIPPPVPGPATMPPAPGVPKEPSLPGAATMPPAPGIPIPPPVPGPATMPPAPGIPTDTPPTETPGDVTETSDPDAVMKKALDSLDTSTETSTTEGDTDTPATATTESVSGPEPAKQTADRSLAVIYFFSALGIAGVIIGASYMIYRRHKANSFVLPKHSVETTALKIISQ